MSKLKTLREEEVEEYVPEGLTDGGTVYLSCSNCRAYLMRAWVTRPHEPQTWKLKATCPFCGDASFETKVKGGFFPAGFGLPKKDDENDEIPITDIDRPEFEGDTILFHILKAKPDVKPVKAK